MKKSDAFYMQRALDLAAKGKLRAHPNPCVGCVIVKNGKVLAEGYHEYYGGPHAEVVALESVGTRARGATMYVTLEPCTHWGKTPPCAPLVARSGVKRVVVAMKDPNEIVAGRGIAYLKKARIRVQVGVKEAAARDLNRSFVTWMTKKRPYVILKMATTLDGKIATRSGESKWISSEMSRKLVHRLRAESEAVLVGARTARLDKPALTSHGQGRDPHRIVWNGKGSVKKLLRRLATNSVSQLLVEGGGETAWRFLKEKCVDEIYFFIAPKIIGGRTAKTAVEGEGFRHMNEALPILNLSVSRISNDLLLHGTMKAA